MLAEQLMLNGTRPDWNLRDGSEIAKTHPVRNETSRNVLSWLALQIRLKTGSSTSGNLLANLLARCFNDNSFAILIYWLEEEEVKPWSQGWLIAAGAYPGFCSMKRLEVFLLPLDGMLVHRRSLPRNFARFPQQFAGTHLYTWVERGTVRVKCLAQEHNTMSPARARTRTTRSGPTRLPSLRHAHI